MKRALFTSLGAVAWLSAYELRRKARKERKQASHELSLANQRNDEAIAGMRAARALHEEMSVGA